MVQAPRKEILSVSLLTQSIKLLVETNFPFVWVEGEISNFRSTSSGTSYFTLKDDKAQIKAVLFKLNRRYLRFQPVDGLHIVCQGRVSIYELRGEYQLIIDHMEPRGIGALQQAFLQLRDKLQAEGLFATAHKKKIPLWPRKVGIISSRTGAALYDFLRTAEARFPNVHIIVYPARVQGEGAAQEIAEGVLCLNTVPGLDVIVLARGGGSFEDLWTFNEEILARAIFASKIPVVSAIGHEVDFTIADFVADARVATPTAAAELVIPNKEDMLLEIESRKLRLIRAAGKEYGLFREMVAHFITRLARVKNRVEDGRLRLENLQLELKHNISDSLQGLRRSLEAEISRLKEYHPKQGLTNKRHYILSLDRELKVQIEKCLTEKCSRATELKARLAGVNPLAILSRGYSITQLLPEKRILTEAEGLNKGMRVKVRLHRGELLCDIEEIIPSEQGIDTREA